jgi:hypothetical protein
VVAGRFRATLVELTAEQFHGAGQHQADHGHHDRQLDQRETVLAAPRHDPGRHRSRTRARPS